MLWILKKIPELDFEDKKAKGKGQVDEKERSKVSFECGKTGFYISLFFVHFNKTLAGVIPEGKRFTDISDLLDSNHGCLSTQIENQFQKDLFGVN